MKAPAQAAEVFFIQLTLATDHLGDDADCAKDIGEVLLLQPVLVQQKGEDFERGSLRQIVALCLVILDQKRPDSRRPVAAR